ncbi:MAG: YbaK/EbsC family protein [Anaerolineae bacterium]|nr:YbaK/EbsC family protein [Anaerolineae bacterium]
MLTPSDLQRYLDKLNIAGEILFLESPTLTVLAAASVVNTQPDQIIKSVLFTINSEMVLAIAGGTKPIERRVIASLYGVGRKRVKLAPADVVLAITGYPVGAVPPFGHPQPIRTLLDPRVLAHKEVFGGGGAHNALLRLAPESVRDITQAQVIDLLSRPQ